MNGSDISENNNTIEITYGDYQTPEDAVHSNISVQLSYDDATSQPLNFEIGGYSVTGLPENLNANLQW